VFPLKDNIPTENFPVVTVALIVANAIVYFFFQHGLLGLPSGGDAGAWPVSTFAYIPCTITGDTPCQTAPGGPENWVTIFSAMFMHGSIVHLGGNMLFLWIFGNNVEDAMGPVRFVIFYLLGGIAALALQVAVSPDSTVPTLGASGAIAGVLGGYILIYPRARVLTLVFLIVFFTFIELPAYFFLFIWFAQQAVFGAIGLTHPTGAGGGVAYFAHVGGFLFGLAAIKLFATRRSRAYGQPRYPVY